MIINPLQIDHPPPVGANHGTDARRGVRSDGGRHRSDWGNFSRPNLGSNRSAATTAQAAGDPSFTVASGAEQTAAAWKKMLSARRLGRTLRLCDDCDVRRTTRRQDICIMSTSHQSMSRDAVAEILRPRFMRITVAMRREMMSASVTTAQSAVLSALLIGQPMRVSDLARNEGVKLPTMTQIIGRMEAAGLVSRTGPPGTYNNLIRITPAGEAVADDLAKQRTELLAQRMRDLTSDELALLHQVAAVLDKMFTKEPWREA
jgi:DNA-binding MarR family transcriptional regulator